MEPIKAKMQRAYLIQNIYESWVEQAYADLFSFEEFEEEQKPVAM